MKFNPKKKMGISLTRRKRNVIVETHENADGKWIIIRHVVASKVIVMTKKHISLSHRLPEKSGGAKTLPF